MRVQRSCSLDRYGFNTKAPKNYDPSKFGGMSWEEFVANDPFGPNDPYGIHSNPNRPDYVMWTSVNEETGEVEEYRESDYFCDMRHQSVLYSESDMKAWLKRQCGKSAKPAKSSHLDKRFVSLEHLKILNGVRNEKPVTAEVQILLDAYFNRAEDKEFINLCFMHDYDKEGYFKWLAKRQPNWKNPVEPQRIDLRLFMAYFNPDWTVSSKEYSPEFSPSFVQVPDMIDAKEEFELWAKTQLLIAIPGVTPDSLEKYLKCFASVGEAMKDFVLESGHCPALLREDWVAANIDKDQKQSQICRAQMRANQKQQIVPPPSETKVTKPYSDKEDSIENALQCLGIDDDEVREDKKTKKKSKHCSLRFCTHWYIQNPAHSKIKYYFTSPEPWLFVKHHSF